MSARTVDGHDGRGLPIGSKWQAVLGPHRTVLMAIAGAVGADPRVDVDGLLVVVRERLAELSRLRSGLCHALALPSAEDSARLGEPAISDAELVRYVFDLWGRHDDVTRHAFALRDLWGDEVLRGVSFEDSLDVASDQLNHLMNVTVARVGQLRRADADLRGRVVRVEDAKRGYLDALKELAAAASPSASPPSARAAHPTALCGRGLSRWMRAREMTQVQAARFLGVSQQAISKWTLAPERPLPLTIAAALTARAARRTP